MRRKVAAARPGNEVAFPMPGHGAIFDRRRPFADRYRVLHLAKPVPFQAGVPRAADRALRPEMLEKLLLQDTTRFNEKAFVDRRSEERSVGKEFVIKCRSRWGP